MKQKWQADRRAFLKATAASGIAVHYPLFAQNKEQQVSLNEYKPIFFNKDEWEFILSACDRLIPADGDGPGALETQVPIFIDLQLNGEYGQAADWYMAGPHNPAAPASLGYQTPLTPAQIYQAAIPKVNEWCQQRYQAAFSALEPEQQDQVLVALQKAELGLSPELRDFFTILLQNTKEGYFADPMYGGNANMAAWKYIGFPGARASFKEWVDQHNVTYPLGPVSISGKRG